MLYRDLIPSRLGGRYIASHISIPEGGPVSDWVHYHRIALQMIYVRRAGSAWSTRIGGEPFVMARGRSGDPAARHPPPRARKLGRAWRWSRSARRRCTRPIADHELELPNGSDPGTDFRRPALPSSRRRRHALDSGQWRRSAGDRGRAGDRRPRRGSHASAARRASDGLSAATTASWCSASFSMARHARLSRMHALGPRRRLRDPARASRGS